MKVTLCMLIVAIVGNAAYAQDPADGESTQYVIVDASNADAVIQDGTDVFESEPVCTLLKNQTVTMLDSTDGEYVMIRAVCDGKTVEGWVKKSILAPKPIVHEAKVTPSGGVDSAQIAAPASVSPGIPDQDPGIGVQGFSVHSPVSGVLLEPILYKAGPQIDPFVHAYFTFEVQPGSEGEYLNARLTDPGIGVTRWLVQNVPIPLAEEVIAISYVINVEEFSSLYEFLVCELSVGPWQADPDFVATTSINLAPQPTVYNIPSGSNDQALSVGNIPTFPQPIGSAGGGAYPKLRKMPNIDLDSSKDKTDWNACGPAAAANSLEWLKTQHKELAADTLKLRARLDTLKKYMNRDDAKGVRFDSMVVGKLTFIDKYKLPIRVKYKTKHESGNTKDALKSTKPPYHTADNKGKLDEHPDFDWFKKEMDDGEDVEVHVGWYGPPDKDGKRTRVGGHWVTATGYKAGKDEKGIYAADDEHQDKAKGLRNNYYKWDTLKGGMPYLKDLKDSKGNIAVVESVVSESYDPTVTFEDKSPAKEDKSPMEEKSSSSVKPPWSDIPLTGEIMKPGYPFVIPIDKPFPWIPVGAGVVGGGIITAILIGGEDDPVDCTFSATATTTNSTCGQSNGIATINVSPSDSYTYVWSNGPTTSALQNVPAGSYSATVTRVGTTCTRVVNATITNVNPSFTSTTTTVAAHCGTSDGSATISVSPPGNYMYIWSNGGTGTTQSNLAAGMYTATISAGGNCSEVTNINITEIPPQFTIDITQTSATCGASDGAAIATVNPAGEYTYLWSNGSTSSNLTGVAAGEYGLIVTISGSNCQKTSSVVISEMPPDFVISFNTTPANCNASDGTIEAIIDPPGNYEFIWSNGITTHQIVDVPAGNYSVTVTLQGTSCAISSTATIEQVPVNFTLTISTTPATCGISDGTASVVVDPPGEYTYQWPNGSNLPLAEGLSTGTYILTVTDNNGCLSSGGFDITELGGNYIGTATTVPGNCLGEGADIIIEFFTPGAGPLEISATGPDGTHVFTTAPGNVSCNTFFTVLPGGWHIIARDVSLSASCLEETDAVVEDITTITAQDDQYETTIDQPVSGNVLNNDNGLHLSVQEYTDPAGGILVLNPDGSFTFTPPAGVAGQFSFQYTVKDTCGNTAIANVTITVNSLDCLFDAAFSIHGAHCGLMDGSIVTVMMPSGTYTFLWSNGLTTQDIINVPAGQYNVTITSVDLNCNKSYVVDVPVEPISYITNVTTSPGNCTGEGEITITLETPGDGPLVLVVNGPEGTIQFTLPPGLYNLSASMNIPSGDYSITVYDQGAGPQCSQTIDDVTVPDNTPVLNPEDDFYETPFDTPVTENVLDNDTGLGDGVTIAINNVNGGIVEIEDSGVFTFTPDPGFSGTATFTYTVTNVCGTTASAFVEIFVEQPICDFTVQFINTNASCGLEDGIASVSVDPPGSYFYSWSTGETGSMINNIPAGFYSVTIEDVNLGCFLEFDTEVGENPPSYITNLQVLQPMCPIPGDIRFDLSSPSGGPFDLEVTLPDGTTVTFTVEEGPVSLLELVPISDGTYTITVFDENAGPSCAESIDVTIMSEPTLAIIVEAILPPSEASSMDGAIVIVVTMPGTLPYEILLNGDSWGVALADAFTIGGLGAGDYTVQIRDANGCVSNILEVTVPLPGSLGLEVGLGLMTMPVPEPTSTGSAQDVEGPVLQQSSSGKTTIRSFVDATLHYRAGGIKHISSISIYGADYDYRDAPFNVSGYRFLHLVEIGVWRYRGFNFRTHGGMAVDMIRNIPTEQYWTLRASATKRIGKFLTASASVSLRGWRSIELPAIEVGVKMPVMGFL